MVNQELAQLHAIHSPEPIGWWPLAWGWYTVIVGLLLALLLLGFWLHRRYVHGAAKREALQLLSRYEQHCNEADSQRVCAQLSELLKRVALAYFPRKTVAGLQGERWIEFLNATSTQLDFYAVRKELLESPYHTVPACNLTHLFQLTKNWIKQRGKPCLS